MTTIDLLPVLHEFPEIDLVYLFGSHVSGQTGPLSDIDIAILTSKSDDGFLIQTRFQHVLKNTSIQTE